MKVFIEHFDSDDTWNVYDESGHMIEPDFQTESECIEWVNLQGWEIIP